MYEQYEHQIQEKLKRMICYMVQIKGQKVDVPEKIDDCFNILI